LKELVIDLLLKRRRY